MTREAYAITNTLRTFVFLAALTGLLVFMGYAMGGVGAAITMLFFAGIMNFFAYWYSDAIVLASQGARELGPHDIPWLWDTVERLSERAGLPMPRLYLVPDPSPNAFATGRDPDHAAVAVTQGLLDLMTPEEVAGVLGHELAHVRNRDILIGTIAATIAGAISGIANIMGWILMFGFGGDDDGPNPLAALLLMILAPIAAALIQMAVSRSREYEADRVGAEIVGSPLPLARALKKLGTFHSQVITEARPELAHMYIVSPLSAQTFAELFSTHPPLEARIGRLMEMAQEWEYSA